MAAYPRQAWHRPRIFQREALDGFGSRGHRQLPVWWSGGHSEDLAQTLCRAVNDWVAAEWLDRDAAAARQHCRAGTEPALRGGGDRTPSAADRRFVQVQLLAMNEMLLGRRYYWPIYEAAIRHDLPIGIHAGSAFRHAPTSIGWPSHYVQDYVGQKMGFEAQLLSLMGEGVFNHFPSLRIVLIESGVTWLPAFLWRAIKSWRGLRSETPWFTRSPAESGAPACADDDAAVRCANRGRCRTHHGAYRQ